MFLRKVTRRALALALTVSFIFSGFASEVSAQRQRRRSDSTSASIAPPRKPFGGTVHQPRSRTYDVLHYSIRTRFDVPQKTVIGDTTVTLKPLSAGLRSFELDASDMEVESVALDSGGAALIWTQTPDKLNIKLDRPFNPDDTISLRIRYRAKPERGLYFIPQSRAARNNITKPAQIWTQGEPEDNHHWFPCYDSPDDKATSEQYITTRANEIAISNGKLVETIDNQDGTRTFHWKMDQEHASYLVSLVVGDYVKMSDAYKDVPLEYYTYAGTEEQARRSFSKTAKMMDWFSRALKYDYPFNRYAQTIVANFIFGGMENITATTHADTEILHGDEADGLSAENLVSHELSHSWFGNLVTAKDWTNLWLNEGFATFFEASFKEHDQGRDAYLYEMRANESAYFLEDLLQYRRPVVSNRYRAPLDIFDATLYKKGGYVVHMLREQVGDEMFWKSLNNYLSQYKYKSTETADLQKVFEATSGQRLDWFFDQWLIKAGYPELTVRHTFNPATRQLTLNVTQTQTPDSLTPAVFRLPVEIELATATGKRTERIEINQRTQTFTFKLDGKPLMIRFDKNERLLKKLDYPQSNEMTAYQLLNSSDAIGRIRAAEALARLSQDSRNEGMANDIATAALRQALMRDTFYGVRLAAASALANFKGAEVEEALLKGMLDVNPRVRLESQKALALQNYSKAEAASAGVWLRTIFAETRRRQDLSAIVF
jgi:aminopeptidase N